MTTWHDVWLEQFLDTVLVEADWSLDVDWKGALLPKDSPPVLTGWTARSKNGGLIMLNSESVDAIQLALEAAAPPRETL